MREVHLIGRDALDATTALLQRARGSHPTFGLYEAADLQWWSRVPRSTDDLPQLVWLDDHDQPVAAAIVTDWGDRVALDPLFLPDATSDQIAHVVDRGLAHAAESGFAAVEIEVDREDTVLRDVLAAHGFEAHEDTIVETWMRAEDRPAISALPPGYRLVDRSERTASPHHFTDRSGPDVEARLRRTSLYRPDLDLLVLDESDAVAAYGLFWYDPVTETGLVEPMRTEDDQQRRGLARHILTSGVERLASAGATRIKICFEPDNAASKHLYLSAGFEPDRTTVAMRRAQPPAS